MLAAYNPVLRGKLAYFYAFFCTVWHFWHFICVSLWFNCSFHLALKKVAGPPIVFNDVCDCLWIKTLLVVAISIISVTGCHPPCRCQCLTAIQNGCVLNPLYCRAQWDQISQQEPWNYQATLIYSNSHLYFHLLGIF